MIGTDENRAVLYVEVIFWSGKRKTPPSLMSGKYCPHFVVKGTTEYLGAVSYTHLTLPTICSV